MMYGSQCGYGAASTTYFSSCAQYSANIQTYRTAAASYQALPYTATMPERSMQFEASTFLNPNRTSTPIIKCSEEIQEMIEETFEKVTGTEFPRGGIRIQVLPLESFQKLHSEFGGWRDGIMGFSINKFGRGTSEISVREEQLDQMMLTIGHEIGHVMSATLPDMKDEEAKAHAFSLAWMEAIREYNIGGLQSHIMPNPAHNGLHDTAFDYVRRLLHNGMSPYDIFQTLSKGLMSIIAEASS